MIITHWVALAGPAGPAWKHPTAEQVSDATAEVELAGPAGSAWKHGQGVPQPHGRD